MEVRATAGVLATHARAGPCIAELTAATWVTLTASSAPVVSPFRTSGGYWAERGTACRLKSGLAICQRTVQALAQGLKQ